MNSSEYHEAVELSLMRRHMKYGPVQYAEDWNSMIAMAVIQAEEGEKDHLQNLMRQCMNRILAYYANHLDKVTLESEMPWAEDGSDYGVLRREA